MRSNNGILVVVLGTLAAALCTGACKKSSEMEREESSRAELHSAQRTVEVRKDAFDEKNDWFAAVRREQLELRARLQEDVDDIDTKLAWLKVDFHKDRGYVFDSKSKDAKKIQQLIDRRQKLAADINIVDRSDERGWDEIKATIERDLGRGKI